MAPRRTPLAISGAPVEWAEREAWFADTMHVAAGRREFAASGAVVGDHAQALLAELETVFCAGAWVATVILAAAAIESQLREVELTVPARTRLNDVFDDARLSHDYEWLRLRRNRLLHAADEPSLTTDMMWFESDELEDDARRAVELAADVLFRVPSRAA